MICTVCGKDGAAVYTRMREGKKLTLTLCEDCLQKLYPENGEGYFSGFARSAPAVSLKPCPICGTTLADFRKTGLLGCAHCYEAFRAELLPAIRRVQGKIKHEGRAPSGAAEADYDNMIALVREQENIKERLKEAQRAFDEAEISRLKRELDAVNRKLYKGESQ